MKTLKINLFYRCTAQCTHCRFNCTEELPMGNPDYDTPYMIAKQLKDNFGLDMAVVLGGEPSIFAAETHELLRKLDGLGISTRLETNACWAVNPEAAREFLRPVKSSNTRVMFSLDAFHDAHIPFDHIVYAVNACLSLDIPFNLEIPYLDINKRSHPIDRQTEALKKKIEGIMGAKLPIYEGNVIFIGRAAAVYGDEFATGRGMPDEACTHVPWWIDSDIDSSDLLILEPGGWITKGCGIAMGNVFQEDPVHLIRNYSARNHPIFSVLLSEGPAGLAKEAEKHGYRIKQDYADKCHLCHEARQVLKDVYPDVLQPDIHYVYRK